MPALAKLTPEARAVLYHRYPAPATEWVSELARERGWEEANRRYLDSMRARGFEEMSTLMEDLGVGPPISDEDALELLEAALAIYLPEARAERIADEEGHLILEIYVTECPTYCQIEESEWHGVTACGSWHRRQGWYQALGLNARDTVTAEKKWGDPACAALVQLVSPPKENSNQ